MALVAIATEMIKSHFIPAEKQMPVQMHNTTYLNHNCRDVLRLVFSTPFGYHEYLP